VVVCGAPNVSPRALVPLALPGTTLPSGMAVTTATIRRQTSAGMLCSEKELGLSEDHSGIMILPADLKVGERLSRALGLEDIFLEINVTPNRPDCLSLIGVARELSAIFERPLTMPELPAASSEGDINRETSVTILDPDLCPRYAAQLVRGVRVGPSPLWLRQRLQAVGIRSISNVVDVTNFVLMEFGQPLHAFDLETLEERRIVVRRARPGEVLVTLDGTARSLSPEMLVIADGKNPVALAGIMGGEDTEIQAATRSVLIESAYFEPGSIRRTSKKLALSTEASIRFERGVDIDGLLPAMRRAAGLMASLSGGQVVSGWIDNYPVPMTSEAILVDPEKTGRFLGLPVSGEKVLEICRRLSLPASRKGTLVEIRPPSFRRDLTRPVDVVEEIARLIGYERIPVTYPPISARAKKDAPAGHLKARAAAVLQGLGFDEIITYSFISEKANALFQETPRPGGPAMVRINNPLSEDQSVMRLSLIPGLLMTVSRNWTQRNLNLRLFEMGKVFLPLKEQTLPEEVNRLCVLWTGRRRPEQHYYPAEEVDFYDLKGVLEELLDSLRVEGVELREAPAPVYFSPGNYVRVYAGKNYLGELGRISREAGAVFDLKERGFLFDLNLDLLLERSRECAPFQSWPRFPEVTRDMALIVSQTVLWQAIREAIDALQEPLIERIDLFDLYQGKPIPEGKKNLGVRLHYRSPERTLSDEEVNAIQEKVLRKVLNQFGASLRER
jgi:phenylalanyl-tRNA synthetase beta chain